ncbi:MAG: AbrB/MazE/SpoVT family DNA-binding domain-containing protein [Nitrospirae bacterium]|nr:MAG: AbrB/MazE/SpoVT family DNA-binding domain-containing protein [Nitrospirota bacterium]
MEAVLKKWGNSVAVRLPAGVLKECGLTSNARVNIMTREGKIVLAPMKRPHYSLAKLLAEITPTNRHDPLDFGRPQGREAL